MSADADAHIRSDAPITVSVDEARRLDALHLEPAFIAAFWDDLNCWRFSCQICGSEWLSHRKSDFDCECAPEEPFCHRIPTSEALKQALLQRGMELRATGPSS